MKMYGESNPGSGSELLMIAVSKEKGYSYIFTSIKYSKRCIDEDLQCRFYQQLVFLGMFENTITIELSNVIYNKYLHQNLFFSLTRSRFLLSGQQ